MVKGTPEKKVIPIPVKPVTGVISNSSINQMSPYETMEAENADKLAGTSIVQSNKGNRYVTSCNNFDYIQFSNIDFGKKGATQLKIRVSGLSENSEIEVVLDDTSGTVVGNCKVPATGGEEVWV